MNYFDHFNTSFDRVFNPPEQPEDTRTEEDIRTAIAETLDREALEPENMMHLVGTPIGEQENLYKDFRQAAANAIDIQSEEAFLALGKKAAEIIFKTMRRDA